MSVTKLADSAVDRELLITENLGLVHSCAHRFTGRGIEYEDLFQAGSMGLVKAFDAFDCERGVRFSTYAVPVILGEMRRLFRDGGTVKVSRSLKELSIKATRERENFLLKNGREPTVSELSLSGKPAYHHQEPLLWKLPLLILTSGNDNFQTGRSATCWV